MATETKIISLPNEALVCCGSDKLEVRSIPLALPASAEGTLVVPERSILVKVRVTGICGSDVHFWKHLKNTTPGVPFILGHECAGEIAAVGFGVSPEWKEGDRIVIMPGAPCRKCVDCTSGQANLCQFDQYFGNPGIDGACCTYKIVPEVQLCRLRPKISWPEAGLIQPLAIAIQMTRQAGLKAHQHVMILGGGCIGLMLGAMAKAFGAAKVVVVEKSAHRASFAKQYCADQVFQSPPHESGETTSAYSTRVSNHILDNVPGLHRGFDVCIEACGVEETMQMGLKLAKPNGVYVQVGLYFGQHPEIPMMEIVAKQLTVKGTYRYTTGCFEQAVDLVDRGVIDIKRLVSHTYLFGDALEAFEACHKMADRTGENLLKTVILHADSGVENEQ